MHRPTLIAASIFGILAVIIGAFGAHGFKSLVQPEQIVIWEKGVQFQFYHTLALLATGLLYPSYPFKTTRIAAFLFGLGIVLFSGSLYLMVGLSINNTSIGAAGIITPIGGLCFIGGWFSLLLSFLKKK